MRKILMIDMNGQGRLIEIPLDWKMTFGRVQPGEHNSHQRGSLALRVYEGTEKNLRACFNNIHEFYDVTNIKFSQPDKDGVFRAFTPEEGTSLHAERLAAVVGLMEEHETDSFEIGQEYFTDGSPARKRPRNGKGRKVLISNITDDEITDEEVPF